MVHEYFMPAWFLGYNVGLHLVFAIITLLVSIFAFRIHRLSGQRQPKLFATAFLLFSLSLFIEAFLNLFILFKINQDISLALKIVSVNNLNLIMANVHLILFSVGLITLAYMTLKARSAKVYSLLLIITLAALFLASNPLLFYSIISFILLVYIFIHYLLNYLGKKRINSLLVFIAFVLLSLSNIPIIFSVMNHEIFYAIGHFIELIAYLLILINLILVLKHEQKTRQASDSS
jgi:hypothetical protein